MTSELVQVPASLLLSPDLPAAAKLIWMVARLRPASGQAGTTWFSAASGLSRPTILAGIARLVAAGWDPARDSARDPARDSARDSARDPARGARPGGTVPVPAALLTNHRLGIRARVLYGLLLLTPGFHHPGGRFTYAELAGLAQASTVTVSQAVAALVRAEWIKVEQVNRLARIHFELQFPGLERGRIALARAQGRLEKAPYYGEGLMREYLSLLIDSEDYEDDANPGFLVNPRTDERLQLDRFYPPRVAFEFNGPQHYRATGKFPARVAAGQRERDYVKLGICVTRGITLAVIHPEDLTLAGMRQKVGNLLPARDLTGHDLLIGFLEAESRDYRRLVSRL